MTACPDVFLVQQIQKINTSLYKLSVPVTGLWFQEEEEIVLIEMTTSFSFFFVLIVIVLILHCDRNSVNCI